MRGTLPALVPGRHTLKLVTAAATLSKGVNVEGAAPRIDTTRPGRVAVGATVVVQGAGFGATRGTSTVTVGGLAATVETWSDQELLVRVPGVSTGRQALIVATGAGSTTASLDVRALLVDVLPGRCESSALGQYSDRWVGSCQVLSVNVKAQRAQPDGSTLVDLEIENIRPRWYELTLSGLAVTGGRRRIVIAPQPTGGERGSGYILLLKDIKLAPGRDLTFFADGSELKVGHLYILDIFSRGLLGRRMPYSSVAFFEGMIGGFPGELVDPPLWLPRYLAVATSLWRGDVWAAGKAMLSLAGEIAVDPGLAEQFAKVLGVSTASLTKAFAGASLIGNIWKLSTLGAEIVNNLLAPNYQEMTVRAS